MTLLEKANTELQQKTSEYATLYFGGLQGFTHQGSILVMEGTDYVLEFDGYYFQARKDHIKSPILISSLADLARAVADIEQIIQKKKDRNDEWETITITPPLQEK